VSDNAMMYGEGVFSSRPSAASAGDGHVYFATDTGNLYRSNGTTWTQIATLSGTPSSAIGSSELIYRYTVAGTDKASIDTGVDTAQAGSNDWTNGDLLDIAAIESGELHLRLASCELRALAAEIVSAAQPRHVRTAAPSFAFLKSIPNSFRSMPNSLAMASISFHGVVFGGGRPSSFRFGIKQLGLF